MKALCSRARPQPPQPFDLENQIEVQPPDFREATLGDVAWVTAQGFIRDGAAQFIGTSAAGLGRRMVSLGASSAASGSVGAFAAIGITASVAPVIGAFAGYRAGKLVGTALGAQDGSRKMIFCKTVGTAAGGLCPIANAFLVPYLKHLDGADFAVEVATQLSWTVCRMAGQLIRDTLQVSTSKMVGSFSPVHADGSTLTDDELMWHGKKRSALNFAGYTVGSGAHQGFSIDALQSEVQAGSLGDFSNLLYSPGVGSGLSSSVLEAVDAVGSVLTHWMAKGVNTRMKYTPGGFELPDHMGRRILSHAAGRVAGFGPVEACSSIANASGDDLAQASLRSCAAAINGLLALRGAFINMGLKVEIEALDARLRTVIEHVRGEDEGPVEAPQPNLDFAIDMPTEAVEGVRGNDPSGWHALAIG